MSFPTFARAADLTVAPLVTFDEDTDSITSIRVGGRTWQCATTPIFQVQTWVTSQSIFEFTILDSSDFETSWTTSSDGVVTMTAEKSHLSGTIRIVGVITPDSDSQQLRFSCTMTNDAQCAVAVVSFPRFAPIAPSGDPDQIYVHYGIDEGYVRRAPHLDTTIRPAQSPAGLNCIGYWDATTGAMLYFERRFVDDDVMPYMSFSVTGAESDNPETATIEVQHVPQHGRTYGNDYDQDDWYTITLESVEGLGDGRSRFQDMLDRYAIYAKETSGVGFARTWMPTQKWWERDGFSSKVQSARIFTRTNDNTANVAEGTTVPDYSFVQTEFTRLKANLAAGAGTIIQGPGHWHANEFDHDLPAHTPQRGDPDFSDHIATIAGLDGFTYAYVNPFQWHVTMTTSPYDIGAYADILPPFTNFGDMTLGMHHDADGNLHPFPVPAQGGDDVGYFDYGYWAATLDKAASGYTFANGATASYITANLMLRYCLDAVDIDMVYIDLVSGFDSSFFQTFDVDAPFGGGNHGRTVYGRQAVWEFIRGTAKLVFGETLGFLSESPQEAMLTSIELTNFYDEGGVAGSWGCSAASHRRLYGDYQRHYSYAPQVIDQNILNVNAHIQQCFCNWLRTGMISYLNDTGAPIDTPITAAKTPIFDTNTDYTDLFTKLGGFAFAMRKMYASLTYTDPYVVKGTLTRPTRSSFELSAMEARDTLGAYTRTAVLVDEPVKKLPHAVYRHFEDETWGIVALNHISIDAPFNIYFEAREHDMPPATKILSRNNLDGTSTEITRFTHVLDVDVTLAFGEVGLWEIELA